MYIKIIICRMHTIKKVSFLFEIVGLYITRTITVLYVTIKNLAGKYKVTLFRPFVLPSRHTQRISLDIRAMSL